MTQPSSPLPEPSPAPDAAAVQQVTMLLDAMGRGEADASERLLATIYEELRRLASARMRSEPVGHTLQATALVHEAYLRLIRDPDAKWENRRHFFGAAARAMRRILVERHRRQAAEKHGGGLDRIDLDLAIPASDGGRERVDLVALDEALDALERQDPRMAQIVMLRFFSGLGVEEVAAALDVSPRTVKRDWNVAKAWLFRRLAE